MQKLDSVDAATLRDDVPAFRPGDTLKVHVRVVEGNEEPVVRDRVFAVPYISEDDARRISEEQAAKAQQAGQPGGPPRSGGPTSSGLYVPGRD